MLSRSTANTDMTKQERAILEEAVENLVTGSPSLYDYAINNLKWMLDPKNNPCCCSPYDHCEHCPTRL